MTQPHGPQRPARFWAAAGVAIAAIAALTGAHAQTLSERDLIEALQGKGSRGAGSAPAAAPAARNKQLLDALENRGTRAFSAKERTDLAVASQDKPSVDLMVYFDFNSASITDQAKPTLATLGRALASDELRGSSFMIAGHTDAKGKAAYNQALSERRANAVRDYLVKEFNLEPRRLVSVGYGRERLKDAQHPYAAENRRVQIVNLQQ
jgi:outer membrane protein OmpA-like peptidoglycan-associated protein